MTGDASDIDQDRYALVAAKPRKRPLQSFPTAPRPGGYRPGIGLIGAGGITVSHLDAYKKAGYRVVAISNPSSLEGRRAARRILSRSQDFNGSPGGSGAARVSRWSTSRRILLSAPIDRGGDRRRKARLVAKAVRARSRRRGAPLRPRRKERRAARRQPERPLGARISPTCARR